MRFESTMSGDISVLRLQGECTVEHSNELKAVLISEMKKSDKLILDLGEVTEVDISFLQLLCSAHISSVKMNKQFSLNRNQPQLFIKLVNDAGYCRNMGCEHPDKHCLWEGGIQ